MTAEVILDGWYETEDGLLPVYETGDHLEQIVDRQLKLFLMDGMKQKMDYYQFTRLAITLNK